MSAGDEVKRPQMSAPSHPRPPLAVQTRVVRGAHDARVLQHARQPVARGAQAGVNDAALALAARQEGQQVLCVEWVCGWGWGGRGGAGRGAAEGLQGARRPPPSSQARAPPPHLHHRLAAAVAQQLLVADLQWGVGCAVWR